MGDFDTSIGSGGRRFATTQWSRIADFQQGSAEDRRAVMEDLIRAWWKPVYYYIRLQWRRSNEDSKDLTQRFFTWLIDGDVLDRLRQERGRCRSFLKAALHNFVVNEVDAERALKRGGGRTPVAIEDLARADAEAPADGDDPSAAMDREWKRALLARALERLRRLYVDGGKETQFEIFRVYAFEGEDGPKRREVAGRYGVSDVDVKNFIADARRVFKRIVHDLVSETVADPELLREEIRELFGKGFTA